MSESEWPDVKRLVEKFNKRYFVVRDYGGKCHVCWEDQNPSYRGEHLDFHHQTFYDFGNAHHRLVQTGAKSGPGGIETPKLEREGKVWLESPSRREYERVVFLPGQEAPENQYNLWRGFAYPAVKGNCSLYLAHLKDNVCDDSPEKYKALTCWMAYQARNPSACGQTAIALQGQKGVGKNVAAEGFASLWGRHWILLADSNQVTGRFNAHLRNKCVLVADEAFFAKDHRHDGPLKSLITGSTINIEAKGVDMVEQPNYLRIILMSNDLHIVNATSNERRYLVLRVNDRQIQNKDYFRAIQRQLDNGGYSALLYHLLNEIDLSGYDPREALVTEELSRNQIESARDDEAFVLETLMSGSVPCGHIDTRGEDGTPGDMLVNINELAEYANKKNWRAFGRISARSLQEILGENGLRFGRKAVMRYTNGRKCRFFNLYSLSEARKRWDNHFYTVRWPDNEEWDEPENWAV